MSLTRVVLLVFTVPPVSSIQIFVGCHTLDFLNGCSPSLIGIGMHILFLLVASLGLLVAWFGEPWMSLLSCFYPC